tara:strand:- start:731 stop:1096 length:366 start_codon:yes stop_codon:yes gene_type:complete
MPNLTLTFTIDINELVQVGDTLYYANTANHTLANGEAQPFSSTIVEIGAITAIDYSANTITATIANTTPLPTSSSFILFGKDNRANMASLLGYYAEVEFINNSTSKAELFSVGSEVFESSK